MAGHFDGNVKSVAKLIILEEYLDIYTTILKNKWESGLWYVDTHAGTGRTKISNRVTVDGSALRALENHSDDFDAFYLYELNPSHFETLYQTIAERMGYEFSVGQASNEDAEFRRAVANPDDGPKVMIMEMDSNQGVRWLADHALPDRHWFTFVDPKGLTARKDTLDQLLERGNLDILINYQSSGALRSANAEHAEQAVTRTIGDRDWIAAETEDDYVELFEKKLAEQTDYDTVSERIVNPDDATYKFDLVFGSSWDRAVELMEGRMTQDDLWGKAREEIDPGQAGLGDFS